MLMCIMTCDELMEKMSESCKKIEIHFNDLILNDCNIIEFELNSKFKIEIN